MLFNSYAFLLLFLPVTLLVFAVAGRRYGAQGGLVVLAGASLVFYGWWNPVYLNLVLASIAVNFALGLLIERAVMTTSRQRADQVYYTGLFINLALIAWFKYSGFLARNIEAATGWNPSWGAVILPLGISFFTFQQIAYLHAVLDNGRAERNVLRYTVFISFFAHLIAGPIVHPNEILPQLQRLRARLMGWNLARGGTLFVLGLAKKMLLADPLGQHAATAFASAGEGIIPDAVQAWSGLLCYTLQIYFDFSGYSDMAMGLAMLFGIRFPVNFNSPYRATSIIDFWRRWHMTLSQFLRNFVYIPLGGARRGEWRRQVNLMATMLIGGLWHGANWNFVLWGGLHGAYLVVNHLWRRWRPVPSASPAIRVAGWLTTFLAVMLAWVLFRTDSLVTAEAFYRGLLGQGGVALPAGLLLRMGDAGRILTGMGVKTAGGDPFAFIAMVAWVAGGLAISLGMPNSVQLFRRLELDTPTAAAAPVWHATRYWAVALGVLAAIAVLSLSAPSEFIYFNF